MKRLRFLLFLLAGLCTRVSAQDKPAADWKASIRTLLSQNNHAGAAQLLAKLLPGHEKDPTFLNLLGATMERAGRGPEATTFYQRSLSLRPQSSNVRLNLALNYVRLGRLSEASAEFTRLLKEAPIRPPLVAAYQQSEDDAAMETFVSAVPGRERDWYEMGLLFLRHGRIRGAQAIAEAALKAFPNSVQLRFALGRSLQEGSRFEAAEREFARVLELQPTFADAALRLGYSFFIRGNYAEAIRVYQSLLGTDPEGYEVHYFIGRALARSGDSQLEAAARHLRRACLLNPASFDSHAELGSLLLKSGNLAGARHELELANRLNPDDGRTHFHLAQVYSAMGERALARQELRMFEESRRMERERARRRMDYDLLGEPAGADDEAAAKALEFIEVYKAKLQAGDFLWIWERLTPSSKEFYDNDAERFRAIAAAVFGSPEMRERLQRTRLEGGKVVSGRIVCEFASDDGTRLPPLVLLESEGELRIDYAFEWTTAGLGYLGAR